MMMGLADKGDGSGERGTFTGTIYLAMALLGFLLAIFMITLRFKGFLEDLKRKLRLFEPYF